MRDDTARALESLSQHNLPYGTVQRSISHVAFRQRVLFTDLLQLPGLIEP
jgi:hypothetical protein